MPEPDEKPVSEQKNDDRITTLDKWFTVSRQAEKGFLQQAEEDERFYLGDQWDSSDKQALEDQGKPALVYNYIFPLVNLVNGYHRQNKLDIKVFNRRGGSREVAEILQKIIKDIMQAKNGDWEISYAHLMGLIMGKAYMILNMDYDDDVTRGNLFAEFHSCFEIAVDPFGSKYDLTDRDYFFKSVWMPKEKIDRLYPEKVEDGIFEVSSNDRMLVTDRETFNYKEGSNYQSQDNDEIEQFRYRVKECWWKEYVNQKFLVNAATGKAHDVSELAAKQIKRITEVNSALRHIKRIKPVIHMSQYVGKTELFHSEKPMGDMKNLPIVGFFPYFLRNTSQGMITQLKSPQREHNKRMSQALHHLNQTGNSGYTADADAVDDWDELEKNLSKPGYIKKIRPGKRFDKDHPNELSQGHIILANSGATAIKLVSGVNSDLLGQDSAETVSGIAIARRQAQGLMTTEIVHDNMRLSLKILGDRMVEAIQKTDAYSQDEVLNLVLDGNETPIEINRKVAETQRVLNDVSIGRYETTISTSIQTPTARMANYMSMLEAIKMGAPIPPEILAEAADWPEKDKILKAIEEQKAANAATQKALMAAKLGESAADRQNEIQKIQEKTKGTLLVDAQKEHLAAATKDEKS